MTFSAFITRHGVLRCFAVAAVLTTTTMGALAAPALAAGDVSTVTPEQQAASLTRPAIDYLEMHWTGWVRDTTDNTYFNDGKPIEFTTSCTGFNVNAQGYLATAGHCVDPGPDGAASDFVSIVAQDLIDNGLDASPDALYEYGLHNWAVEGSTPGSLPQRDITVVWGVGQSGVRSGEFLPARVVDFRSVADGDVALLKAETSNRPALQITTDPVDIGTHVVAVGYPGSADDASDMTLEPSNKEGTISATRTDGSIPVYEISAAATHGMSGGPVVDTEGNVIGLVSRGFPGETQAFNLATPSTTLAEIMARNGVKNELGPVDQAFRKGMEQFYAGHYRDATTQLDQVLAVVPSHQQAQEYKQKAAEAIAAGKDPVPTTPPVHQPQPISEQHKGSGGSATPLALLLGGLGLAGGGSALAIKRRRAAGPTPTQPSTSTLDLRDAASAEPDSPMAAPTTVASTNGTVPARESVATTPMTQGNLALAVVESAPTGFCTTCGNRRDSHMAFCPGCGGQFG